MNWNKVNSAFCYIVILFILPLCIVAQTKDSAQHELQAVTIVGDKAKSIPGSGQYINRSTLDKLNQINVNNVLRLVPGVSIRDEEGFGLRPNIGLRGTAVNRSAKITLMEDGVLIAPATYSDPAAYYFPTFSRMQGIEVLKGTSQIKYGPYTVGGAVNLISRTIPESFAGQALASYGSFGTNQQQIWLGDSREHLDYVVDVNRLASSGFKELDGGGNTGFERRDVMMKLRWHTKATARMQQSLSLKVVSMSEVGHESYLGLTFNDYQSNRNRRYAASQADRLDMNHQHLNLTHGIAPFRGANIITTLYYGNTRRNWVRVNTIDGQSVMNVLNQPDSFSNAYKIMQGYADGNVDLQGADRSFYSTGIQSQFNYQFTTSSVHHELQVGVRVHADQADRYATRNSYTMTNGVLVQTAAGILGNQENQLRYARTLASYVSYALSYKQLKIVPGFRIESMNLEFKNYGTADNARLGTKLAVANNSLFNVLPGMGVHYEINGRSNVFGGVHKGFSPPGMPVLNSVGEQAQSEFSTNYEIGYRYNDLGLHIQAVGFLNNYRNILGSDNISGGGMGTGNMYNAGNARVAGMETYVQYNMLQHTQIKKIKVPLGVSYTYTHARFLEAFVNAGGDWGSGVIVKNDCIPFITPHVLSVNVGVEKARWNATVFARYNSQTRIKPSQGDAIYPSAMNALNAINAIPAFLIIDMSANYALNNSLSLFTQLGNITNSKAIVSNLPQGYRPNMPFSVMFGIKAHW